MSDIIRWMQDIEDFKCVLCKESFLPPYALPYLLPCTHSLCTKCLQTAIAQHDPCIICPQDLESNSLAEIRTDTSSRRALQRLVREHKNYSQNNQLLCIQSLSKHLEALLEQQQKQRKDFLQLIDQIFRNEVQRLNTVQARIHNQLDNPFKVVKQWKQNLKAYLQSLKGVSRSALSTEIHSELAYYIEQGRRIKQDLASFQNIDYQQMVNSLIVCSTACLSSQFTVKDWANQTKPQKNNAETGKSVKTEKMPSSQKIASNFSTNQSAKKKMIDKSNKQNEIQKKVLSQPIQHRKSIFNYSNNNEQNVHVSILSVGKERSAMMGQTVRQRQLKQQVLQQLQINGDSSDTRNLLAYSPSPDISLNRLHSPIIQYDELLLTEKQDRKPWSLGNYNFLQQCEVGVSRVEHNVQIKKREPFNWQRQNNNYMKRMSQAKAEQAYANTAILSNSIQLINHSLQDVEISLLLQKFEWGRLEVVKFVRTNLSDGQLNELLNFAVNSRVQTLVLSGNCLSERALDALCNYMQLGPSLRNVYISRNCINCLRGQTRAKIVQLRQCGLNLYI